MISLEKLKYSTALIFISFLFTCCARPVKEYKEVSDNPAVESSERSEEVTLYFSDFGKSKLKLEAQTLISSENNNQIILECPDGLNLIFYDSLSNIESVLLADYGKLFAKDELLLVKKNVQFRNYQEDTLFANELTIDFCKKNNADFIVRGLRNVSDFEFEKNIALTNRKLSGIETVFLLTSAKNSFISSGIVRDLIKNNGDYSLFIPGGLDIK